MIAEDDWQIGIDLIDHGKFERFPYDIYEHFYKRVFTTNEIEYCRSYANSSRHFTGLFAAKEAIFKAANHFGKLFISQFEITHKDNRPQVLDRKHHLNQNNLIRINQQDFVVRLSISHSANHSVAMAAVKPLD